MSTDAASAGAGETGKVAVEVEGAVDRVVGGIAHRGRRCRPTHGRGEDEGGCHGSADFEWHVAEASHHRGLSTSNGGTEPQWSVVHLHAAYVKVEVRAIHEVYEGDSAST